MSLGLSMLMHGRKFEAGGQPLNDLRMTWFFYSEYLTLFRKHLEGQPLNISIFFLLGHPNAREWYFCESTRTQIKNTHTFCARYFKKFSSRNVVSAGPSPTWWWTTTIRFLRLQTYETTPCSGGGAAKRYRYRSIEVARGIAIELSKYHSIGWRPDGSLLTLFLDTGAKNSQTNLLCSVHLGDNSIGLLPRKSGYFFGSSVKIVARPLTTASTSLDAW